MTNSNDLLQNIYKSSVKNQSNLGSYIWNSPEEMMRELTRKESLAPKGSRIRRWLRKILGIESLINELGATFCRAVELTVYPLEVEVKDLARRVDKLDRRNEVRSKLTLIKGDK